MSVKLLSVFLLLLTSCIDKSSQETLKHLDTVVSSVERDNIISPKDRKEELDSINDYVNDVLPELIIEHLPQLTKSVNAQLLTNKENTSLLVAIKQTNTYSAIHDDILNLIEEKNYSFKAVKEKVLIEYFKIKRSIKEEDIEYNSLDSTEQLTIGSKIYGDFNGDGKHEYAFRILVKKGYGNPVEDGVPDEYEIKFSDASIKSLNVGCCWFHLLNEGDLNNDGADNITIVQDPENGCLGLVSTYTFKNNIGARLFDPFFVFICDGIDVSTIESLVTKEDDVIYVLEIDPDGGMPIKTKAVLY